MFKKKTEYKIVLRKSPKGEYVLALAKYHRGDLKNISPDVNLTEVLIQSGLKLVPVHYRDLQESLREIKYKENAIIKLTDEIATLKEHINE